MAGGRASTTAVLRASAQRCVDTIMDFEAYPQWQAGVKSINVLERDEQSALVDITIDIKIKKVSYTLRYHVDGPGRIWWDYVKGDIKSTEGEYRFTDLGDGTTEFGYEVSVEVGGFVPGPIKNMLRDSALNTFVREFTARVEGTA